jgi:hypothetical protein
MEEVEVWEHVAHVGEYTNAYSYFLKNNMKKRSLGKARRRWG